MPSFLDFLPISVTIEHWVEFPVLYSRFSLVIYFMHSSEYVSVPISQSIPPLLPSLFPSISFLFLYFCFTNKFIYAIFLDSAYISSLVLYLLFGLQPIHSGICHYHGNEIINQVLNFLCIAFRSLDFSAAITTINHSVLETIPSLTSHLCPSALL